MKQQAIDCKAMYPNWWFESEDGSILPFFCNSWQCVTCSKRNRKKMRVMILKLATAFNMKFFWTLTIRHNMPLNNSWDYIQESWRKFRYIYARKTKQNLVYIKIPEPHKSGYPHIHFLTNVYLNVNWLRRQWKSLGGGYRVHIEQVSVQRIAGYLSKYLSKMKTDLPKGYRHYSLSRKVSAHWQIIKFKSDKTWVLYLTAWVYMEGFGDIQIIREVCKMDFLTNNDNIIKVPPQHYVEIIEKTG